jgi:hypothetical protein
MIPLLMSYKYLAVLSFCLRFMNLVSQDAAAEVNDTGGKGKVQRAKCQGESVKCQGESAKVSEEAGISVV